MRSHSKNPTDLLAALWRMDQLVCAKANMLRECLPSDEGEFRGVFISEAEFDQLLARPFGETRLDQLQRLTRDSADGQSNPTPGSRWAHLLEVMALSPLETDLLLLCLLPELDLKYERIYAYLQDDLTRKRPSVQLALEILCPDLGARLAARALFSPQATLFRQRLLSRLPSDGGVASLLAQALQVNPEVVSYLLQIDNEAPLSRQAKRAGAREMIARLALPEQLAREAASLSALKPPPGLWVQFEGEDAWTARRLAQGLAAMWGFSVAEVDTEALPADGELARAAVAHARRDALLQDAVLYVRIRERSQPQEGGSEASSFPHLNTLMDELHAHPLPVFWESGDALPPLAEGHHDQALVRLGCPRPSYARRLILWCEALSDATLEADASLEALASRYRLSGQQIEDAARASRQRAWQRQMDNLDRAGHGPPVGFEDLTWAARQVSSAHLGQLARQITSRHDWPDLVLPQDRVAQLQEICDQFKFRHRVYDEWGLGSKDGLGRGLSALFAGPSGTGKTMAAGIMAGELAIDLFKIDLSGVVSKYIGETEKNLERIFGLARDSNAILLFDEADALFGKRSETKDAHDRYANIEVSYLLQKIEEYDGIVVLTSNLRQNLDEAFLRRLQFTVEFPLPDEEARLQIWERLLHAQAPVDSEVDLSHMAERFRLSGGSIRNVVVNAAFLAAREEARSGVDPAIGMAHLLWATRREFQKLGKLVDDDQFPELVYLREASLA